MSTDPDVLRAMPERERLTALQSMTPDELADLQARTREARAAADARYGPSAFRYRPSVEEPPDIDLRS